MTAPQITHRSPATLTPWPRNARTHSKKQIRQIVASIRQFGFTVPGHCQVESASGTVDG